MSVNEEEFYDRAREFLREFVGSEHIGLDADLIHSGVLDSLLVIAFIDFIETQRGVALSALPNLSGSFSLRAAYKLLQS